MSSQKRNRYTRELKDSVLVRMMPPNNESVKNISTETGISVQSLYKWRKQARSHGNATPGNGQTSERCSSEDKILIVLENYTINEVALAEYSRKKACTRNRLKLGFELL